MTEKKFKEDEIPYDILSRFGLTQEMLEDLPRHAMDTILQGRRSAMFPIRYEAENGTVVHDRSRIHLVRDENGKVQVMFSPQLQKADLSLFNDQQKKDLESGKAVFAKFENPDTKVLTASFYQVDPGTRQVLSVPSPMLGNNLQVLLEKFHLTNPELACLRNGDPLTVYVDDNPVTMGIDLNNEFGIRIMAADEEEWRKSASNEWKNYSFGINGCWVRDKDGQLDYVREEDYDDELWAEQKNALQNRQENQTHRTL